MGIYDRDYSRADRGGPGSGGHRQIQFAMPSMTPVVKWLLIINAAVFIISALFRPAGRLIAEWFSVFPVDLWTTLQVWRLISYQFLHDFEKFDGTLVIGHVFFNMIVLFFFGPMLERQWGSKRFLWFYLACGAAGGVLYPLLVLVKFLPVGSMVGASGAIFGMLAAGAILYPRMKVLVLFIFPIPLAVLAGVLAVIVFLKVVNRDSNAGGEAAHLAGMAVGAAYVLCGPWVAKRRLKKQEGAWQKRKEYKRQFETEVDRILEKVHNKGVTSLNRREKKILKQATEQEQRK